MGPLFVKGSVHHREENERKKEGGTNGCTKSVIVVVVSGNSLRTKTALSKRAPNRIFKKQSLANLKDLLRRIASILLNNPLSAIGNLYRNKKYLLFAIIVAAAALTFSLLFAYYYVSTDLRYNYASFDGQKITIATNFVCAPHLKDSNDSCVFGFKKADDGAIFMLDNLDELVRANKENAGVWNKIAENKEPGKKIGVTGTFSSAFGEKDLRYDIVGTIHAESIRLIDAQGVKKS